MYNSDIKARFIASYTTSLVTASSLSKLFEETAPAEEAEGVDLCAMKPSQISKAVNAVDWHSDGKRRITQAYLRAYGRWCRENGVPGARQELCDFRLAGASSTAKKLVAGPHDLQKILDDTLSPESDLTVDNVIRVFYWLVFAGMRRDEIEMLTAENVDFSLLCVKLGGREYPIYPQALPAMHNVVELASFRYVHPKYAPSFRDRYPGNRLLRMIKSDADTAEIEKLFSKKRAAADPDGKRRFNYSTLRKSGFFYRYYVLEREGVADPFEDVALMFLDESQRRDSLTAYNSTYSLKQDYAMWKDAFRV